MKKIISYKKHWWVLGTVAMLSITSCTKLKDKNYTEINAAQYVPTKDDLGSLVGPAYAGWRNVLFSTNGLYWVQELSGDEIVIPARPYGWVDGGKWRELHEHSWTPNHVSMQEMWSAAYSSITNCNRVIYQVETGSIPVEESLKQSVLSELKVLRASYYYTLCDMFGNVPIVTKFDVPEGFLPEQSTRKQVYDFIVAEITAAIPNLGTDNNSGTYGRFSNKWSAYALLARMYLNAKVYAGTAEWEKCLEACNAIISSGKYELEAKQRDVFVTKNENSKEIVFAVPFDEVFTGGFYMALYTMCPQNQQTYNSQNGGWGGVCAIPQFIDSYNPQDERVTGGWIQGQQYTASGQPLTCAYGTVVGQPLKLLNEVPGVDSSQEIHGYRMAKYEYRQGMLASLSNDVPLLRYTDVLMMKAECLLRTGKADEAATIVTDIRRRSFTANPAAAVVTGAQLTGPSVYDYGLRNTHATTHEGGGGFEYGRFLDELGWEFATEGRRRTDLIRFGAYSVKSWLSHTPGAATKILMPIPQQEINKNPKLKQNEGY
ncbi:MAG TPA: RagB/SusD family nutrient uptake outer membrane protein [Ferruginibacter sp.]|nr:RagB/SusD family nutrient uptake outer membrane protein [Ferruginibacter sp.]HMP19943.1 RagB/SusD family nutrient uptake outer membrane protein [Ferruginibacter sp.]